MCIRDRGSAGDVELELLRWTPYVPAREDVPLDDLRKVTPTTGRAEIFLPASLTADIEVAPGIARSVPIIVVKIIAEQPVDGAANPDIMISTFELRVAPSF